MANDNQNQVLDEQTDVVEENLQNVCVNLSRKRLRVVLLLAYLVLNLINLKNEEYMSEGQLEHFRQILMAWKAELMSEVDRTLNTMQDENTALPDV